MVKYVRYYFADMTDFERFNAAYWKGFSGILPVRTTVASALKGIKFEIDAIARKAGWTKGRNIRTNAVP